MNLLLIQQGGSFMDGKDVIMTRRTIFKFKPEPVSNDVIEQVFSYL